MQDAGDVRIRVEVPIFKVGVIGEDTEMTGDFGMPLPNAAPLVVTNTEDEEFVHLQWGVASADNSIVVRAADLWVALDRASFLDSDLRSIHG